MLVFHNGSNTSYANYADNLTSMSSATTAITMRFLGQGASATATSTDAVVLTVTANTQKAIIEKLVQMFNGAKSPTSDGFLVISDDTNSVFAHPDITGCAITVTAAA